MASSILIACLSVGRATDLLTSKLFSAASLRNAALNKDELTDADGKSQLSASQPRVAQPSPPNRGWTMALRAPVRPCVTCPSSKNWNWLLLALAQRAGGLGCVFDTLGCLGPCRR